MNARTVRESVFLVALVLAAGGAGLARAQTQAQPETTRPPAPKSVEEADQLLAELQGQADATLYESDRVSMAGQLLEARQAELKSGSRVAVEGDSRTVFMDTPAMRASLRRHVLQWTMAEFKRTGDYALLRDLGDADAIKRRAAELEADVLEESENYRQWLAISIQDVVRRKNKLMERYISIWGHIHRVREERARLAETQGLPVGRYKYDHARTLSELKGQLGEALDEKRKAGNWSADHHMQVGTLIGVARTVQDLGLIEGLMLEYAGCYDTKNLRRAEVLANARTGMYKTPGDRIAALDKVSAEFNTCVGDAAVEFHTARARLSNPGK